MADKTPPKKGRPRGSGSFPWRAFFQQSTTPVFVLGKGRRLRFANPAWEKLTGVKLADALGMVCSARRHSTPLAAALAPTPEAQAGKPDTARRPGTRRAAGTPWWDIAFAPLAGDDGLHRHRRVRHGRRRVAPHAARKIPASVAALREKHAAHFSLDLFAGSSPAVERFLGQLRHAAQSSRAGVARRRAGEREGDRGPRDPPRRAASRPGVRRRRLRRASAVPHREPAVRVTAGCSGRGTSARST